MVNKEGYLEKKVQNVIKGGWDRRYIKLENKEFSYYSESKGVLKRKGILSFDIYQVTVELDAKEPGFWLRILNSKHEFFFRAPASEYKTDEEKYEYL